MSLKFITQSVLNELNFSSFSFSSILSRFLGLALLLHARPND